MALLGTLVVLLAPMPAVAKSLWIGMVVAVALAARGIRASPLTPPGRGERIALAALSVWLVYLGTATLANRCSSTMRVGRPLRRTRSQDSRSGVPW